MASNIKVSTKMLILSVSIMYFLYHFSVCSFQFEVGGTKGWIVPQANESRMYNDWASDNRFKIGDSVYFKYLKDSVLEVTEKDYKWCNSSHPNFFSNTGHTVYNLNHSGTFYFISGVFEHCEKGEKMMVRVIADEDVYSGGDSSSSADFSASFGTFQAVMFTFVLSYVVSYVA